MAEQAVQWHVIDRWVKKLEAIPEVDIVWVEGSLVDNRRPVPGTDIDIRIGIQDEAFDRLWSESDKTEILAGLGRTLRLVTRDFIRLLTEEGVIVELVAHERSSLNDLKLFNWEILLNRLPDGPPDFDKLPVRSPAEKWPEEKHCTPEFVQRHTETMMTSLASAPASFYNGEMHSARFIVDEFRSSLIRLMYRCTGVYFAKRYKHFTEILSPECLADLESTYVRPSASSLDAAALAEAMLRASELVGKYLQKLSDLYGGGFESEWYWRLQERVREEMLPIMNGTAGHASRQPHRRWSSAGSDP